MAVDIEGQVEKIAAAALKQAGGQAAWPGPKWPRIVIVLQAVLLVLILLDISLESFFLVNPADHLICVEK